MLAWQGIDHTILDKLLSMVSVDFAAEVPLFPLERLEEGDFLQSAVDCSKLFADQQFDILEVSTSHRGVAEGMAWRGVWGEGGGRGGEAGGGGDKVGMSLLLAHSFMWVWSRKALS